LRHPTLRRALTPTTLFAVGLILLGLVSIVLRFVWGLGRVTHLSQTTPWGLWIGFDVLSGVALAAGGYTMAFTVHILAKKQYEVFLRPAILTGFLGYVLVALGLSIDVGRPWRLPYPLLVSWGTSSVMLEVAWCVFLYLGVQFLELCPAFFEKLGWSRARHVAARLTTGVVIAGVVLSTLHQSSLGSLFLLAPDKVHPLWYSRLLPLLFFTSSVVAGIGMVILESTASRRYLGHLMRPHAQDTGEAPVPANHDRLIVRLGMAGFATSTIVFLLRLVAVTEHGGWPFLRGAYGALFLVEIVGLSALPAFLFAWGSLRERPGIVLVGAVLAVSGVVLNRLAVSFLVFNWQNPSRYVPHPLEIATTLGLVTLGLAAFRLIATHFPIFSSAGSPPPPPEKDTLHPQGPETDAYTATPHETTVPGMQTETRLKDKGGNASFLVTSHVRKHEAPLRDDMPRQLSCKKSRVAGGAAIVPITLGLFAVMLVACQDGAGTSPSRQTAILAPVKQQHAAMPLFDGGGTRMPHLPEPYEFRRGPGSPGTVTFSHESHVSEKTPDCTACHPRLFRMLTRAASTGGEPVTHRVMDRGGQCGTCHNGRTTFGMKECDSCHIGSATSAHSR